MKKILFAIALVIPVIANSAVPPDIFVEKTGRGDNFEQHKAKIVSSMGENMRCVEAAQDKLAIKRCHQAAKDKRAVYREKRQELREDGKDAM